MSLLNKFDYSAVAAKVGLTLRPRLTVVPVTAPAPEPEPEPTVVRPRPGTVLDMVGCEDVRSNLLVELQAAQRQGRPAPHTLLTGPPGTGKTTVARVISTYMGTALIETTPASLDTPAALAAALMGLSPNDVLFIDEIHDLRTRRAVLNCLYLAAEDGFISVPVGTGATRRLLREQLAPFTLVGATTNPGDLPDPLLRRFSFKAHLELYEPSDLATIIIGAGPSAGVTVVPEAAALLAARAKGTPAVAINLLGLARSLAVCMAPEDAPEITVDPEVAAAAMERHHIDSLGLDVTDRLVLTALCTEFGGGPVGIGNLVSASGVDQPTIKGKVAPYLIKAGLLKARGTQGWAATFAAYDHLSEATGRKLTAPVDLRLRLGVSGM